MPAEAKPETGDLRLARQRAKEAAKPNATRRCEEEQGELLFAKAVFFENFGCVGSIIGAL